MLQSGAQGEEVPHKCAQYPSAGQNQYRPTSGRMGYITRVVSWVPNTSKWGILSHAVGRWGPLNLQGLCSQYAHCWGIANFVPRFEEWGPPHRRSPM